MKYGDNAVLDHQVVKGLLKEGLERNQRARLQVSSQSMRPLLRPGDTILVQQIDPIQLAMGDLVVLDRNADLAIHRLIKLDIDEQYHTKGDNVPFSDPPVSGTKILGRVVAIERGRRCIDLTAPQWARVNRMMGLISGWETTFMQSSRRGKNRILSRIPGSTKGNRQKSATEGNEYGLTYLVRDLLRLPLRLLMRVVLGMARFGA